MSLTFFAKSWAYSWKMSFEGQVLWKRNDVCACAVDTIGKAMAPAPRAPAEARLRKRRRCEAVLVTCVSWVDGTAVNASRAFWVSRPKAAVIV